MAKYKAHAVALFSGGLDSCLAVLLMLKQNVDVIALTCTTQFGCDLRGGSSCSHNPYPAAEKFGFAVEIIHLGQEFTDIVRNPPHGHGKNINPCVDCRILMLREAKKYMEDIGADVVITGEVMGQRPFSQMKDKMYLTMREAGLKGRLLRPLSAKLLEPTIPEIEGLIDREQLEGISGRSRARQIKLAQELGLEDYPSPAGGCLLTDPEYTRRLRDLFAHQEVVSPSDLDLLRVGRQFRYSPKTKIIIGRNEAENAAILANVNGGDLVCEAQDTGSPITLVRGDISEEVRQIACALTARYCDLKSEPEVAVAWKSKHGKGTVTVPSASQETLQNMRV